jgi:hypothetical protein
MADGRLYTNYQRRDRYRDDMTQNGFHNSNDYRNYQQTNADYIMEKSQNDVVEQECNTCDVKQVPSRVEKYANLQDADPDMIYNTINSKVIETHKQQGDLSITKPHLDPDAKGRPVDQEFHRGIVVQQPDMMLPGQMPAAESADVPNMQAPGTMPAMYPVHYNTKQREPFVGTSVGDDSFKTIGYMLVGVALYHVLKKCL